ncbi:MAG TPA: hypothetical protein PKJ33_03510 [Alphaproteobacteria bacterium]|nr:hypothetical protein [Alphaproteobacteria bacterium]
MPNSKESLDKKHFFEDSINIFNMNVSGEIKPGDMADSNKREKILKIVRKKRLPHKTLSNKKNSCSFNDNGR